MSAKFSRCHLAVFAALSVYASAALSGEVDGRAAGAVPAAASTAPAPVTRGDAAAQSRRDGGGVSPADNVIADDLVVQGSGCLGIDCVENESFGFDTLRLKENNLRIKFEDTSASAGFPTHDWQLTANDSASGGVERFSIEDVTAATVPFTVRGSAPSDALYVSSLGQIGLRTNAPALDLHLRTGNTPALRLEQDNSQGWTAQVWDIGANESNFFVRDFTGGSKLPLRIRPGAPTSSLDIAGNGNVGIGTNAPTAKLDVNGDMIVHGTIAQLSSRTAKEHFVPVDGKLMLAKLDRLPISSWNYRGAADNDRHVGPVAEDFHAAFGLGASEHYVAPTDMAGVALVSVKALQEEVRERDRRIDVLEARLRDLEARLNAADR